MSKASISQALRQQVAKQSLYRCVYCQTQEIVAGTHFTVDHIIPESLGGQTKLENLCLACWDCNLIKGKRVAAYDLKENKMVALFHPNKQLWDEHFTWQEKGVLIQSNSATGRVTINTLKLNRPLLIQARKRWIKVGWHPPKN